MIGSLLRFLLLLLFGLPGSANLTAYPIISANLNVSIIRRFSHVPSLFVESNIVIPTVDGTNRLLHRNDNIFMNREQ